MSPVPYYGLFVASPSLYVEALILGVAIFGNGVSKEVINVK